MDERRARRGPGRRGPEPSRTRTDPDGPDGRRPRRTRPRWPRAAAPRPGPAARRRPTSGRGPGSRSPAATATPRRSRRRGAATADAPRPRRRRRSGPGGSRSPESARVRPAGARGPAPTPAASCGRDGTPAARRRAAPARHRRRRRAAPARARPHRHRAAAAARRPAPRRAGGPRGQPRAVRRRRLGLDGGAAADGRGEAGAVLSLLRDAYQRRDKVGLVTFRGTGAEVVLPPTSSVPAAQARLAALRTGGRTPLADGLLRARGVLRRRAAARPPPPRPARGAHRRPGDGRGPATTRSGTPAGRRAARRGRDRDGRRRLRGGAGTARPGRAGRRAARGRGWSPSPTCRADRVAGVVHAPYRRG